MKKENTRLSLEKFKVAKLTIDMRKVSGGFTTNPQNNSSLGCVSEETHCDCDPCETHNNI